MNIPIELWKEISLFLPHNHLSLNKEFISLYDENWCHDKLLLQYPNCKQYDNWITTYKRSLKVGEFILYNKSEMIQYHNKQIKITRKNQHDDMFLTFDGDLYFSIRLDCTLLSTNVTDICSYTYIKSNEWYDCEFDEKLIVKSEENFISIAASGEEDFAAITDNIFYFWCQYDNELIRIENKNNIKMVCNGFYLIQDKDGIVKRFDYQSRSLIKVPLPKVRNLYQACVELMNGQLMKILNGFRDGNYYFYTNKFIINSNKKLRNAINIGTDTYLLLDNDLYLYRPDSKLQLIHENVKNLYNSKYFVI